MRDNHAMEQPREPQRDPVQRLTLRRVASDFLERFLSLEDGWLRTVRELSTAPGKMIRRYVEGERKAYANPFAYLAATVAVSYAIQAVFNYREQMMSGLQTSATEAPAQAVFIDQATEVLFTNLLFVSFLLFIPVAVLPRLFFRRSDRNLAEVLVFTLFCGGHLSLLGVPLITFVYFAGPKWLVIQMFTGYLMAISYTTWAGQEFFLGAWPMRLLKNLAAYLLSYVLLMSLSAIGMVAWMLNFGAGHFTGEDWSLMNATEQNAVQVVNQLLADGADPNKTFNRTALHLAVETGRSEIVDLLLAHGADLNARDHLGRAPLFLAVATRRPKIARVLMDAGADATILDQDGTSMLYVALKRGYREIALWTLDNGVDVNAIRANKENSTVLILAASEGDHEMVELLLERGADPSITNKDGKTALDLAVSRETRAHLSEAMTASNKPEN
jgi:hypothetical protein